MTTSPILQLKSIVKTFGGFTALHNINLEIRESEFLTIVGPSGSGKTTMIRLLVGMDSPTSGEIYLRNQRIDQTPANKRPTCMVFQSLALFPHRTVGENIEFPLKIKGISKSERKAKALELLELLRLPISYYDKRPAQCSGGERQRVALARALAFDPEILFFDEPLSALDYRLRKALEKELKDLHTRTGKTFVYITHSLEEAMVMSDRIAIMRAGRFEQIAGADEIYSRPVSRFVAEFMGEVNLFDVQGTDNGLIGGGLTANENFGLRAHEKATLMVRPESVRFCADDDRPACTIKGVLRNTYQLGSRIQYLVVSDDGKELTIESLREDQFHGALGDPVTLGWDASGAHLIRETP